MALRQGITEQALTDSSNRFTDIKTLIGAFPAAPDQKAMLELQASIDLELGILQNEQSKLQSLYQAADAQEGASRQATRELVVAGHGHFQGRFEPSPP